MSNRTLTIRLDAEQAEAIEVLKTLTGRRTATGAIMSACESHVGLVERLQEAREAARVAETERDQMRDLIRSHIATLDDMRDIIAG